MGSREAKQQKVLKRQYRRASQWRALWLKVPADKPEFDLRNPHMEGNNQLLQVVL